MVADVLKYQPQELIEKFHFYNLHPKSEQEEFKAEAFKVFAKKKSFINLISSALTKDGEIRWIATNGFPILSQSGELLGYRGSDTDITERILAEEALVESDKRTRENETRLREIGNNLPNGMIYQVVQQKDGKRYFTHVSEGVKTLHGFTPEEVLRDAKLLYQQVHPDDIKRMIDEENSSISALTVFDSEVRFVLNNGDIRWRRLISSPRWRDTDLIYDGIEIDITEKKLIEMNILKERENFFKVFESSPVGLLLIDQDYSINRANKEIFAITLRDPAKIIGQRAGGVLGCVNSFASSKGCGFSAHCPNCSLRQAIESVLKNGVVVHDKEIKLKLMINGKAQERWISVSADPVEIEDKKQVIVVINDVTERKNIEEKLLITKEKAEAANRAKSNFLANMSHEIRTPMNAMLGMIEVMSEYPLQKEQKELMDTVQRSGELVVEIINNILDLSKIESGTFDIINVPFNLREELKALLRIFSLKAQEKELFFTVNLPDHLPEIFIGDAARIKQVLSNFLTNAIKFTSQGGIIVSLSIEATEGRSDLYHLTFSIKDTGIGIEQRKVGQLFERFNQLDPSITRQFGGTGLGLSICKQIVNLLGGTIKVESTYGKGSCFSFALPLTVSRDKNFHAENLAPMSLDIFNDLRILVVDDAEENRQLVHLYLRNSKAALEDAINGEEACQKFFNNKYDAVIMDISMPILDGHSATRMIRAYEEENQLPPTPIIACTAYALINEKEQSFAAGCDFHLSKPLSKKIFLKTLAEAIQKKQGA